MCISNTSGATEVAKKAIQRWLTLVSYALVGRFDQTKISSVMIHGLFVLVL